MNYISWFDSENKSLYYMAFGNSFKPYLKLVSRIKLTIKFFYANTIFASNNNIVYAIFGLIAFLYLNPLASIVF